MHFLVRFIFVWEEVMDMDTCIQVSHAFVWKLIFFASYSACLLHSKLVIHKENPEKPMVETDIRNLVSHFDIITM